MGGPGVPAGKGPGADRPSGWISRARSAGESLARRVEGARPRHVSLDVSFSALERDKQVAAGVLAGGLAFRLFLWLLPLGLISSGLAGFLPSEDVAAAARELGLAGVVVETVEEASEQAGHGRVWLLGSGVFLLAWTGATAVRALELTHALTWSVPPRRGRNPIASAAGFSAGCFALVVAGAGLTWTTARFGNGGLVFAVVPLGLLFALWMRASWLLPRAQGTTWRDLVPGAMLFVAGAAALHAAIAILLAPKLARSQDLYGGLGLASSFLFWLYLMGRITMASAILNAALWERRSGRTHDPHDRLRVDDATSP